ncbi:hypothetical protein GE09DRAFT_691806 [Coniochaeta sp. 2T2.1]|nr:hypothetical protein GE09DRAFT_691806 [Coniochaeta sp. 2T2.1]
MSTSELSKSPTLIGGPTLVVCCGIAVGSELHRAASDNKTSSRSIGIRPARHWEINLETLRPPKSFDKSPEWMNQLPQTCEKESQLHPVASFPSVAPVSSPGGVNSPSQASKVSRGQRLEFPSSNHMTSLPLRIASAPAMSNGGRDSYWKPLLGNVSTAAVNNDRIHPNQTRNIESQQHSALGPPPVPREHSPNQQRNRWSA